MLIISTSTDDVSIQGRVTLVDHPRLRGDVGRLDHIGGPGRMDGERRSDPAQRQNITEFHVSP